MILEGFRLHMDMTCQFPLDFTDIRHFKTINPLQFQEKMVSMTQVCDLVEHITTRVGATSEVESKDCIIRPKMKHSLFMKHLSICMQHTRPLLVHTSLKKIHIHCPLWSRRWWKKSREFDGWEPHLMIYIYMCVYIDVVTYVYVYVYIYI